MFFLEVESTDAFLQGQQRLVDLCAIEPRLPVLIDCIRAALAARLAAWEAGEREAGASQAVALTGRIAFVFSGNGAQHAGMAQEALRASSAFRRGVQAADTALAPRLGVSPTALIKAGITEKDLLGTDLAQPLLFTVQMGILAALRDQGITPDMVLGHSVGEVAAAHAAGLPRDAGTRGRRPRSPATSAGRRRSSSTQAWTRLLWARPR